MMLKSTLEDSDIAVLKLLNGDTVISRVIEETDEFMVLYQPMSMTSVIDTDNTPKIAYKIWMPFNENSIIVVNKSAMMALCVASPYYRENYLMGAEKLDSYKNDTNSDVTDKEVTKETTEESTDDNVIYLNPDKNIIH
jgi:hypothetical protein